MVHMYELVVFDWLEHKDSTKTQAKAESSGDASPPGVFAEEEFN